MEPKWSPNGTQVTEKGTKVTQNLGTPWDRQNTQTKKGEHSAVFHFFEVELPQAE